MTDKERFHAIMAFEPPDRMLYWEQGYWGGTIQRWYEEGMLNRHGVVGSPEFGDTVRGPATPIGPGSRVCHDAAEGAGLDAPSLGVPVNLFLSPPFDDEDLGEEEGRLLVRDAMGIVKRISRDRDSIPLFEAWPVTDMASFETLAAERLNPVSEDRFPSDWEQQAAVLNAYEGVVALGGHPCGFFGAARYLLGEVRLLMGFLDNPEFIHRVINHLADLWCSLYERVLTEVNVDCIHIWEDMAFKNGPLISPELFRQFLVPAYDRVTSTARHHGVKTILVDTDGDCRKLIQHFLDGGVTGLYPFEVQSGMDVKAIRETYPRLQLLGGIDKMQVAEGPEAIDAELSRRLPGVVEGGGYIPMGDHQIPPEVSWKNYR
jgi:uroporphyrinogen decarboxylase